MALYPECDLSNVGTYSQCLNTLTNGWFWTGILAFVYCIVLIRLTYTGRSVEPIKAFAGVSWAATILAILFRLGNLVPDSTMFVFIFLGLASGLVLFFSRTG
jgi:hypothetical protein